MSEEREPISRIERIGLAAALLLALGLMWPVRGYLTDDTFIHLQYARNLAAGRGFVFNAGEHVYGSTSPLWVALLAAAMRLRVDGIVAAHLLGLAATLASVVLFFQLARRSLRIAELRALATITWAANAWMIRWSLSGMETPLGVALVLAGFVALTAGPSWGLRPVRTGVFWACAALTRPEAAFLLVLWGVFLALDAGSRSGLRRLVAGMLPPLLLYGGWLAFAHSYFGSAWPNTLAAKTASFGFPALLESFRRQVGIVGATDAVLALALAAALVFGGARVWPKRVAARRLLPWVWLGALPLLYGLRGVPVLSRYMLPVLPVLAWLAWRAVERWWAGEEPSPQRRRRAVVLGCVLAALAIAQNLAWYRMAVVPQVRSFTTGIEQSLVPWGKWFALHTDRNASIAAPDIGAIGYYSDRRVVDLAGLVTPRMVPLLEREPAADLVANFSFAGIARPGYLIDRAPREYDLLARSRFAAALVPLGHASVPNLGIAHPGIAVYSFYRVDWAVYDSLVANAGPRTNRP